MHAALCAQIKEILVEESNVQPVNSPVTVWGHPSAVKPACQERGSNCSLYTRPQRAWKLALHARPHSCLVQAEETTK